MAAYEQPQISRRALLLAPAAALGCGRRKGAGFPGWAFVANEGGRSVAAVDLTVFALTRQIPLEAAPTEVIAHPSRPLVYVLTPLTGVVYEIDASNLGVKRKTRMGGSAISMRMAPDGQALWVLEPRSLARLPLDRLQPAGRIKLPGAPLDFDLSGDGRAAVSFRKERRAGIFNLAGARMERLTAVGAEPGVVRFQFDGKQLLVGNPGDRTVTIVDVATGRIVVRLPLPLGPANFCFNADGGQLFVSGPGMDAVVIIYPYNTEVAETILAGQAPGAMTVSSTPPYLFVANPQSARITVLDIATRKPVAVVPVGQEPGHILITPDNQYALVLNRRSGDVAVIRLAGLSAKRDKAFRLVAPLFTMIPVGPRPVSAAVVAV